MSANGHRLDRIEKARHGDVTQGPCYQDIRHILTAPAPIGAVGDPGYALRCYGKIMVEDGPIGAIQWAGYARRDHPDARYPESHSEQLAAQVNGLVSKGYDPTEIRRAFDLVVTELTRDMAR